MTRAARLIRLAATFALATAAAELVMRTLQKFALHRYLYLSREFVWVTPLADLILFAILALVLAAIAFALPRVASFRSAVTVFATVGALSILTMQPWMTWWAMLALSIGVGAVVGGIAARYETLTWRVVRIGLPVLGVSLALLGAGVHFRLARAEMTRRDSLPPARPAAMNVLVIVWDAVRARNLSVYGYQRATTPQLAALAAHGVAFDHAIATAPYTLPTHASLFTGLWAHEFSASWETALDGSMPTLAGALNARGYRTGAFSANHILVNWEYGLLRDFVHAEDYRLGVGELARSSALIKWLLSFDTLRSAIGWYDAPGRRDAADIRTSFVSWLDQDKSRPFFAFLNVFDAHDPYLPPAPFDTLFAPPLEGAAGHARARELSVAAKHRLAGPDVARQRDAYDGAIAYADDNLGQVLATLEQRGLLRNTLVVVLGDHGEAFGEHGIFTHGNDVYGEAIEVPLVMALPGRVPAGVRVPGLVSVRDVSATIADVLGFAGPTWPLPGRSLASRWNGGNGTAASDTVLSEIDIIPRGGLAWYPVRRGNVRAVEAWPWKLITVGSQAELFNLVSDPGEHVNLASKAENGAVRDSLIEVLKSRRRDAVPSKRN
ncbi:MAG: sulfatase [bacterium]